METEKIWKDFKSELLGFILSKVKNVQLSEDILQDVFVKIHLNLAYLKSEDKSNNAKFHYRLFSKSKTNR